MTIERDDGELEAAFRAARGAAIPPEDLVSRVLADAARVQAQAMGGSAPAAAPVRKGGWMRDLVSGLGGWPAVSGVTLAGVAGLAMGFAAPDLVDGWSGGQIWALTGGGGTMPEIGALWDGAWEEVGDV